MASNSGHQSLGLYHRAGADDPLVGLYRDPAAAVKEFYWVTDGSGRQLAVGLEDGSLSGNDRTNYFFNGGKFAGGTENATTFDASRFESTIAPKLSYFRNRIYDQETGRWTQEDPIGLAGGLNLYQFNGNNPVVYTDPFGLCKQEDRGNCTQGDVGASDVPSARDRWVYERMAQLQSSPVTGFAMGVSGGTVRVAAVSGIQKIASGLVERFGKPVVRALENSVSQLEFKLPQGVKMILRGPETHPINAGGQSVTHYNLEVQAPTGRPGRFKTVENTHLDENGRVIDP